MVDKKDLPWNDAKPWADEARRKWKKTNKEGRKWEPTNMNTKRGFQAGKGDQERPMEVDKEVYDLNYDLAFGNITREEFEAKLKELGG
tara:strand:- start:517 stop:780 length:264 start_codon:yes stop_codon:yes gene_type:complete